jgi:hypothetical protein
VLRLRQDDYRTLWTSCAPLLGMQGRFAALEGLAAGRSGSRSSAIYEEVWRTAATKIWVGLRDDQHHMPYRPPEPVHSPVRGH